MRRYIFIFFCLLLVPFSSCHYFRERGLFLNRGKALESINYNLGKTVVKDTVKKAADTLSRAVVVRDSVPVESSSVAVRDTSYPGFRVIIGSFSNMKNAEDLSEKFKKQGYSTEIIKVKNKPNSLLVSIYACNSREKANDQLQLIKINLIKDAWIYSEKKH